MEKVKIGIANGVGVIFCFDSERTDISSYNIIEVDAQLIELISGKKREEIVDFIEIDSEFIERLAK